jgi:hypothetical protein
MNMLKYAAHVVRGWFGGEGQEEIGTSPKERASFTLQLDQLEIGYLDLNEGVWEFKYSQAFIAQIGSEEGVQPLVDFPDVRRTYRSQDLWPFFMARIPSVSQPRVIEEIERRGIDERSASQLLRAFGERSIANPFLLRSA